MYDGVIILGSKQRDPHVSRVAEWLSEFGENCYVVDWFSPPIFDLNIDKKGCYIFRINGQIVSEDCIYWHRVKIINGTDYYFCDDDERISIVKEGEWRGFFANISHLFTSSIVNDRASSVRGHQKIYQAILASKLGLNVVQSIITNDKNESLKFCDLHDSVITKSLSSYSIPPVESEKNFIPTGTTISTMRLSNDDINSVSCSDSLLLPIFIQNEIRKSFEIRVQIIQSDVFAFKINSQSKKLTEVDWRYGLTSDQFEFFELPRDIESKLVEFLKCSGLFCGAFDLICDESGDYWFLECNPEGQWEWLDEMIDNKISKSFAKNLIELRNR